MATMNSFDAKFGSMPVTMSPNHKFYTTCGIQFVVSLVILLTLQPPFVCQSGGEFESTKLSMINVIILSLLCVLFTAGATMR